MKRTLVIALSATLALAATARADYPPAALVSSPQSLVDSWYRHYLHRPPDQAAAGWAESLAKGQEPEALLATLLSSREYYAAGGDTPTGYIRELFADLVNREPTARELDYWVRRLRFSSRRDVAYDMLVRYPQSWPGWRGTGAYRYNDPATPNPAPANRTFPDPASRSFPDPAGPYFRGYEYRRPIRAFPLGSGG